MVRGFNVLGVRQTRRSSATYYHTRTRTPRKDLCAYTPPPLLCERCGLDLTARHGTNWDKLTSINQFIYLSRNEQTLDRTPTRYQQGVETSSSLAPDFAWVTVHSPSPVLQRGTVCRLTFELHQHCLRLKNGLRLICFCSHIMSHLNQLNSSGVCCTAPL